MIEQITQTDSGYEIVLDGQTLFVPADPGNRHYQMVQAAIADGAEVIVPPEPTAEELLEAEREIMVANAAQIQIALHDAGRLDEVEAIVAASSRQTQIWWSKGERIRRLSPALDDASALMTPQPTPEWWDDLFRAAMALDI